MGLRHVLAIPALLLPACVTTEVVKEQLDPALLERHEERLLKPYHSGSTVMCQNLHIEANPILFRDLALPAGKPHKSGGDGYEDLSWSIRDQVTLRGPMEGAKPGKQVHRNSEPRIDKFRLMIGTTAFVVDDSITVRRLFRAPPTLTTHAKGHVMVIRDGTDASNFQEVRFVDGRVEAK